MRNRPSSRIYNARCCLSDPHLPFVCPAAITDRKGTLLFDGKRCSGTGDRANCTLAQVHFLLNCIRPWHWPCMQVFQEPPRRHCLASCLHPSASACHQIIGFLLFRPGCPLPPSLFPPYFNSSPSSRRSCRFSRNAFLPPSLSPSLSSPVPSPEWTVADAAITIGRHSIDIIPESFCEGYFFRMNSQAYYRCIKVNSCPC